MKKDFDVKEEIKEIMQKNNISYAEIMTELSLLGRQLLEDGTNYMSKEEYQKYLEFQKKGNDGLEQAFVCVSWTRHFVEGIQSIKATFDDVDFSKPFRMVIDYDPEQPRTIVKKYLTKEARESYNASILEKLKD